MTPILAMVLASVASRSTGRHQGAGRALILRLYAAARCASLRTDDLGRFVTTRPGAAGGPRDASKLPTRVEQRRRKDGLPPADGRTDRQSRLPLDDEIGARAHEREN